MMEVSVKELSQSKKENVSWGVSVSEEVEMCDRQSLIVICEQCVHGMGLAFRTFVK
jgi:hypothetical protein